MSAAPFFVKKIVKILARTTTSSHFSSQKTRLMSFVKRFCEKKCEILHKFICETCEISFFHKFICEECEDFVAE